MNPNKSRGHYFGCYDIIASEYLREDFSRRCFIFPGQGSASPGMFKAQYLGFKSIRDKFEKADFLARKNKLHRISDYILNSEKISEDELPGIRNLALFTMEVALCEVLISKKIIPKIVTGHSFGEYAALVVAGVVSFEEMFDIIHYRDCSCPRANTLGYMIAVGLEEKEINVVLKGKKFYVSNINSYEQTVISVSPGMLKSVEESLKKNGARYRILADVPQPYHCPYLSSVKVEIEKYLKNKKIEFKKPRIPLFSSVVKKMIDQDNFRESEILNILISQIVSPVNFIFQISSVHELRCFNFVEINERKVFSSFVENILAGKKIKTELVINILKIEKRDIPKYISPENSKLFSLVSRVVGEITGYEIEKISFEDRYQEDLGIDSIKKADILLTILNESAISPSEDFNTSKFVSIQDTVEYLKLAEKGKSPVGDSYLARETFFGRYIFSWKIKALDDYFLVPDRKNMCNVLDIEQICTASDKTLKKLLLFCSEVDGQQLSLIVRARYAEFDYDKLVLFCKFWKLFLATVGKVKINIALVSSGNKCPSVDGYASFLKSIKKEFPGIFFKYIHFEDDLDDVDMQSIALRELRETSEIDILYRKEQRYVHVREKAGETVNNFEIDSNSVMVVIGGARGITFSLMENISKKYKPVIFLVGRSHQEDDVVRANIARLKIDNPKIFYEALDARDESSLKKLFLKIKNKYGKIDVIINAAGTVSVGFIKDKSIEDIEYELSNKILPAANVLNIASTYGVKKVINFSSVISKYGSAGQSVYTLANEVIAGLTAEHDIGCTVHWPPWDGVGMTKQQGILRNLNEHGVPLLKTGEADKLFSCDLTSNDLTATYYMDKQDDLLYGFSLNDFSSYKALIGELTDALSLSAQNQVFEKNFDLADDCYLADHQIGGNSYVPAAVGMAMFFCVANVQNKKFPILQNFVISNPIIVKDDILKCYLGVNKNGDVCNFSIKSKVLNFSCQTMKIKREEVSHTEQKVAVGEIAVDSFYSDYYFKKSLYLGPTFQCIDKAFLDNRDIPFFRIDNSKLLPVLGCGFYDKLIQWLDSAFQSLSAIGLRNNQKFIPIQVSKLTTFFENDISNYLYVIPSIKRMDSKEIMGDVLIVNEKNEAVLKLSDVLLKSINKYTENRLEIIRYK